MDQHAPIEDPINDKPMPLLEHLMELRRRLMYAIAAFMIMFCVCYYFSGDIYYFLAEPLAHVLEGQGMHTPHLIYTQLYEVFFTKIKVAMFGAAFMRLSDHRLPALAVHRPRALSQRKARAGSVPGREPGAVPDGRRACLLRGVSVRLEVLRQLPIETGGGGVPIELLPRVCEYLDLVMKLIFAFGLTFQLPVALTLLAKVGIVSSKALRRFRRYAYVAMFVVAAILAPPDVFTQISLALPLILLYEISVLMAWIVEPKPVGGLSRCTTSALSVPMRRHSTRQWPPRTGADGGRRCWRGTPSAARRRPPCRKSRRGATRWPARSVRAGGPARTPRRWRPRRRRCGRRWKAWKPAPPPWMRRSAACWRCCPISSIRTCRTARTSAPMS